jgi:hypothetical protein
MVDPPEHHRLEEQPQQSQVAVAAPVVPAVPGPPASVPPASTGVSQPIHETDTFKIGFLVACLVVIILWWRNRVG